MHVTDKALELIEEYNSHENHYKIILEKNFGKPFLNRTRKYHAYYELNSGKKEMIGFHQSQESFFAYGKGKITLNVDGAIKSLEKQLSEIPLRN
ncbi:MAG: hypothetical protein Q8O84_01510 [Nanoarchaeota archaeon]|nr:hypothetical protein [Nanoarchaeota archaeon]